jgi:hypothetical protein
MIRFYLGLALDQVLWKRWSCLTNLWEFDRLVEDGAPGEAEIAGSRPLLWGLFGFRVYVMGMGCRPMGLPMLRPFCNV